MVHVREAASGAKNDMQRGGFLAQRNQMLCQLLRDMKAVNWSGMVYHVGANGDGKGVLAIEVAPDVYVKTWNNFFSDTFDHTLLEPGSAVFQQASALSRGQAVVFSGRFVADHTGAAGACLSESSMTLSGKLDEPEYIFLFESIRPQ